MRRSLIYFWRINLAVLLGAAVATAVLTGALLVGDSVRGSLRDLTLERLGRIDYALVAQKFFRSQLSTEIADANDEIVPAIIVNGNAVLTKSRSRASGINILGVNGRFSSFFSENHASRVADFDAHLQKQSGQIFPSVVINQSLQKQLNAQVGDAILLSFQSASDVHRSSLLGRKKTEDVVESVRLTLTSVIPDRGLGRFSLRPHQTLPLNAYVSLPVLQDALEQPQKVNALLSAGPTDADFSIEASSLQNALESNLRLEDFGLFTETHENYFSLESREAILGPRISEHALSVAEELGLPHLETFTYLANELTIGQRLLPYSTVCAIQSALDFPAAKLPLQNGQPAPSLNENEILLNQWAAADLGAKPGDQLTMTYFVVGVRDELVTDTTVFVVKGILRMEGLAVDPLLTPEFPGIADADNMADWNPPFPVDLNLIRPKDEAYWDQYRGAPKAFVAAEAGRKLWGSRFGTVTSLRMTAVVGGDLISAKENFESALLQKLLADQTEFVFQPIKAQGLNASAGATDFSTLFISFSFFLIASAALLVGLLFRLGVEQRAHEIGIRLAVGFSQRRIRRQFLGEGGMLAAVGALLGLGGAVFYAWLIMVGLRSWSGLFGEGGSGFLALHITPASLIVGYVASLLVIVVSIFVALRKLSRIPVPALLAGVTSVETKHPRVRRRTKVLAISTLFIAAALTLLVFLTGQMSSAGLFFGVGALLLISGLAFFSAWLKSPHKSSLQKSGGRQVLRMAMRNAPRNPGRSMLSAALVGCACFVIIAVEAFRHQPGVEEVQRRDSGAGGYTLVAESDIPLHYDLSSGDGRFELGFSDNDSDSLHDALIMPFRLRPGDDASCLNLYQPEKPRILGVPESQIARGGFQFQEVSDPSLENPWTLLMTDGEAQNPSPLRRGAGVRSPGEETEPAVIPAFGDYNSVLWILHLGLGKDLTVQDEFGQEIKLRFVGLLKSSIFQSEVLISEENFLRHFPSESGYAYFLVQTSPASMQPLSEMLESTLDDYGFDVSTTAEKLNNYLAVENTYLSTFQTLGGLGLLLGTIGLGIILIRNVIERRGELATLRAFGFRRATLALMVLAENGFLLILGLTVGAVSALFSVAPHVMSSPESVPYLSLSLILLLVLIVGMLASTAAVSAALRIPLLTALKAE